MWSVTKARKGADAKHHVAVLVLGDMGRSPRMQYHCASLSKMGDTDVSRVLASGRSGGGAVWVVWGRGERTPRPQGTDGAPADPPREQNEGDPGCRDARPGSASCHVLQTLPQVSFVGFGGEPCSREVEENRRVAKVELAQPFAGCSRRFWLLWAPLKVLFQALQLLLVLTLGLRRVEAVLVQNPPSIPVLAVARLATWAVGARLVIDWHNFGYTILSHTLGTASPIVRVSRVYERLFGRLGDAHLCVTAAMRDWLRENWQIE